MIFFVSFSTSCVKKYFSFFFLLRSLEKNGNYTLLGFYSVLLDAGNAARSCFLFFFFFFGGVWEEKKKREGEQKENENEEDGPPKHENERTRTVHLFPPIGVGRTQAEAGAERDGGTAGAGPPYENGSEFCFFREVEVETGLAMNFRCSLLLLLQSPSSS